MARLLAFTAASSPALAHKTALRTRRTGLRATEPWGTANLKTGNPNFAFSIPFFASEQQDK